jgi:hypothetical protein
LYACFISLMRLTCHAELIHPDLITLIICGKASKLWTSSVWGLQPTAISSHLGPNILHTLFSDTVNLCSSFGMK